MKVDDLTSQRIDDPLFMQGAYRALPLTEAQEGLWYAQRLDPQNPIFNTGHCTEIRDALDLPVFIEAVNQTLREANALSLRFIDHETGPRQYLDVARTPVVEIIDLSGQSDAAAYAKNAMLRDLRTPIDPVAGPLTHQTVFVVEERRFFWFQRVHHLAADGYGMSLVEKRAVQLYRARLE